MKSLVILNTILTPGSETNTYTHGVIPPLSILERISIGIQKILLTGVSNAYFNGHSGNLKAGVYTFYIEYSFGFPINYSVIYNKLEIA